jgi:hypothetical protein
MFYQGRPSCGQRFQWVRQAFLQADGLPLSDVLSEEDIQRAFETENACFAQDEGDIYTPAITLWAFLSQVLHAQRLRSCTAAVSRVIVLCVALGRQPPSPDTGAYCRARAKLPERVLSRLVYDLADSLESRVPADWLWQGRHVKVGDDRCATLPQERNRRAVPPALACGTRFDLRNIKIRSRNRITWGLSRFSRSENGTVPFRNGQVIPLRVLSLQMDDLRGKSPEMVRREIWVHWLAYNLIRKTIAQAALVHEKLPRQLSFAAALAAVATSWDHAAVAKHDVLGALAGAQFRIIAWREVGNRPDRVEPRAIKRHPKPHPWLRQPRDEARARLCGQS